MEMAEGFRKSLSSLQNFAEKVNIQLNIILRCKDDSIALTLLADRPAIFRQLNGSDGRALTLLTARRGSMASYLLTAEWVKLVLATRYKPLLL